MAEKTTPNTFSKGMITDLDPAYQSKESYFTGLNVRVITNGDKSFSLENIKGPNIANQSEITGGDSSSYITYGAVIVNDYLITLKKLNSSSSNNWRIYKSNIADDGSLTDSTKIWEGINLFDENAGKIEIESIVETETLHRIYCTDGVSGLKSINLKDDDLINKTSEDFLAFKANIMKGVEIVSYNQVGGNLKYGSYSYVYRLGSQGQGNYTDWSQISRPINIVKNDLSSNSSLGVEGETSALNSSASLSLEITEISNQFETIQVAAIHFSSENVSTIKIVEEGNISGVNYSFTHSGFETETLVSGGIAAAIISNETWDSCKSLAQKDNKLYASNLKSTIFNIDSTISGYGKLKSYKGVLSGSNWSLSPYTEDLNPHRHYNGSGDNWSWSEVLDDDKQVYKFINKNFNTSSDSLTNPTYMLGAETVGFSEGSDGFRLTFNQKSYLIDSRFNQGPSGTETDPTNDFNLSDGIWNVPTTENDSNYSNGVPGIHNPVFDSEYRGFKRGECYRFGIVFFDKKGTPGFVHHLGDIKMPDAMDSNTKVLQFDGANFSAIDKDYDSQNKTWNPFSSDSGGNNVYAHALIPEIEVRLPDSVLNIISGYRIVRAELQDNDKIIITQGLLNQTSRYHETEGTNEILESKIHGPGQILHSVKTTGTNHTDAQYNEYRNAQKLYTVDNTDVTFRNMSYNFSSGYLIKPVSMLMANLLHSDTTTEYNHKHFGYDADSNMDSGGTPGTGFHITKFKPWPTSINSSSNTVLNAVSTVSDECFLKWTRSTYMSKTVVNQEIITATQHGSSVDDLDYINQSAVFASGQFDNENGELHPRQYDQASRSDNSGETPTTLFVSVGDNTGVPFPSQVKSGGENIALSTYLDNNHRSKPISGGSDHFYYVGFKYLVELIRDTSSGFEQYGGSSQSSIENTRFYPCRDFVPTSNEYNYYEREINRGDVFLDWYSYKNSSRVNTSSSYQYGTVFPTESYVNIALRQGTYLGKEPIVSVNTQDNFLYNSAYSQENNLVSYVVKPTGWSENDLFKAKVAASKSKILGELYDAWSIFPANDFIDLNLSSGQITDLINYRNQLYAVQDSGVSLLSVNSRALIQGEGAAADIQIITGTGTAIERFDYLSNQFGSQHFNTSKITPTGFYFFDVDKKDVIKCDGQSIIPLALSNNYKHYIDSITSVKIPKNGNSTEQVIGQIRKGIHSGYDPEFREVYFTAVNDYNKKNSFIISDLTGSLISILSLKDITETIDIHPNIYFDYKNKSYGLSLRGNMSEKIYRLNSGVYQNFNVGFTINDSAGATKVFDTAEIITTQPELFTQHELIDSIGNSGNGINERVREGNHFVSLREEGFRFRGNWLKYTLSYNQPVDASGLLVSDTTNKNFNIFAVISKIRQSR